MSAVFTTLPNGVDEWAHLLGERELPVLGRTVAELARLREKEEQVTARDISRVLLHDALFAVRVLRYLQAKRHGREGTELTTIEHAVMMIGVTPFFREFHAMPAVEDALGEYPKARQGLMQVMSRAYHAALYARDWATVRRDIEVEEVAIAALLHDLAEMLLWCFAPEMALQIERHLLREPGTRRSTAQREVLGFRLPNLQRALVAQWDLPNLLRALMDDGHASNPRVHNVVLAVDLARHSAQGWADPALPDDYAGVERLLGMPHEEVLEAVHRVALLAARSRDWYGVEPPAARL